MSDSTGPPPLYLPATDDTSSYKTILVEAKCEPSKGGIKPVKDKKTEELEVGNIILLSLHHFLSLSLYRTSYMRSWFVTEMI